MNHIAWALSSAFDASQTTDVGFVEWLGLDVSATTVRHWRLGVQYPQPNNERLVIAALAARGYWDGYWE